MRTIQVEAPGLLTTVQDLGRPGYGTLGVSESGAADPVALRLGNRLVGNPENAAGLEMTLLGATFTFSERMVVAVTGSDFGATLDGHVVPLWTSFAVAAGQKLKVGSTRTGARCYLCVQGGIVVKMFLGSASTHLMSGLGGLDGRPLRKRDVLTVGPALPNFRHKRVADEILEQVALRKTLRVTDGPQCDWFSVSAQNLFLTTSYRVTEEANRMGLRLEGAPVRGSSNGPMITEGVPLGAVQIPSGGQPIILFVEQQTTGGYPKIANIIAADMAGVGQLRPRDEVRFERVAIQDARNALVKLEKLLASELLTV